MLKDLPEKIFDHPDDHAGEMETSLALAIFPQLVAHTPDGKLAADDGAVRPSRFEAINRGWVSITRPWHLLTTNSGAGNPHRASVEKGRRLMEIIVDRLSTFLVDLSAAPIDTTFPF
jgi:creatinine amidohydrolase